MPPNVIPGDRQVTVARVFTQGALELLQSCLNRHVGIGMCHGEMFLEQLSRIEAHVTLRAQMFRPDLVQLRLGFRLRIADDTDHFFVLLRHHVFPAAAAAAARIASRF